MELIILLLIAYLIGSIPSALWVGKLFYKTDIREHGSGNLGGTNTFRVLGKTAGLTVTILDILKGTAAALLPLLPIFDSVTVHPLIPGILAVVGHMYPVFAHFKGGKAVATSGGVLLAYEWPVFIIVLVTFFIALKVTKMVSLIVNDCICCWLFIQHLLLLPNRRYLFDGNDWLVWRLHLLSSPSKYRSYQSRN